MTSLEKTVVRPRLLENRLALESTREIPAASMRAMAEAAPRAASRWESAFEEMQQVGDRFLYIRLGR